MGKTLVIVESPTKARTISKFLPSGFIVESSVGHIRDLPNSAKEIPEKLKSEPWARLGINIEEDFEPVYVVPASKKKTVAKLRKLLKDATELYLATDEDREGESISWHLVEVLKPKVPRKRLVFHEITREAIQEALKSPRDISEGLVEAQEARRLLDRLYGYEVSPLLWRKIAPRLSAGRVQSVAVKIVVDRERERQRFHQSVYWDLAARFGTDGGQSFETSLVSLGGKRIAQGSDFDAATGKLKTSGGAPVDVVLLDEAQASELAASLRDGSWKVKRVEKKPDKARPAPPFTTSTLQQEANRKLRFSARDTMRTAQRLYENGFITYMRTDSTTLSDQAIRLARGQIEQLYGNEFLAPAARQYRTKVKNAQEAHEAIRPAGTFRLPEDLRGELGDAEFRLYELIWKRTMACQMADARVHNTTIQVSDDNAVFQASGRTIEFPGFLRAYVEGADDPETRLANMENALPDLSEGEPLTCEALDSKSHSTKPPRRYTEASLIRDLEAEGVGRPSTYATIIDTILRRKYVLKQGNSLVPTFMAFAVVGLLEKYFSELVDIQFTARMEDTLDAISLGKENSLPYLKSFYFGGDDKAGLKHLLEREIDARQSCTLPLGKDSQGRDINVRIGRYGPYLERGEERASIPSGMPPDELTLARAEELLEVGSGPRELGTDPDSGKPVYAKSGRFGPYVQLGDNGSEEKSAKARSQASKPKMKGLLPEMKLEEITLEDALRLLGLPRSLGVNPETGEEVLVDFGRFGPYIKSGSETRSLPKTSNVFEVSLQEAQEILKQPKRGRSWGAGSRKVLRELGVAKNTNSMVRLLDGRYGPYVTDGEYNASVPKGTDLAAVTLESAVGWLRERAASGKGKVKSRRSTTRGTAAGKSASTRKSAAKKKSPAKKTSPAKKKSAKAASKTRSKAKTTKETSSAKKGSAKKGSAKKGSAKAARPARKAVRSTKSSS